MNWFSKPDPLPIVDEAPGGAVDVKLLRLFLSDLELDPDERVFFFHRTNTHPSPSLGMAGLIPPNYHLLVTTRRVAAIARDKRGKVALESFPLQSIRSAGLANGVLTRTFEMVVADPDERMVQYPFTVSLSPYLFSNTIDFISNRKGGFEGSKSVMLKVDREAQAACLRQQWNEQRADLLTNISEMFSSGQQVVVGVVDPGFEEWIVQNIGQGEKLVACCYSGDEALVVSTDKVVLLKKGMAKAAVSSSGIGTVAGALSNSWLGLAAGLLSDLAVGAQGVIAKSVDYSNISSIDCTKGMAFGHLEFTFPGAREVRTGGFVQNAASENVFQFLNELHDYMILVANEIRRRIKLARQPQSVAMQSQGVDGIPGLIKQLGSLREAGLLTDEEFQAKKRELLAKM